jgi:deazaflavin-dependent oxidoreductase (nitroreductase family)
MTEAAAPAVPRIASWLNERTKDKATPAALLRLHRWLYQKSQGRCGHGMIGASCLVLTTTGQRSHEPRVCVLAYARDAERYVLTASNDGLDRDPAWLWNVRAEPSVTVQVARRMIMGSAQVVERASPDYLRLWSLVNAANHARYDGYQARTARPIPLVVIEPSPLGPER